MNMISARRGTSRDGDGTLGQPLVSVVVPAYNHERYIAKAIESVVGQSYRNLELIVVDDGSSDGTWAEIERLHKLHASSLPFDIYHKANEGACKTFNFGVRKSSGSLVCILASDDWFHADKVQSQVELFQREGDRVGLAHSGAYAVFEGDRMVDMRGQYLPAEGAPLRELLSLDTTAIAPSMMFRRDVFDRIGGFDETLKTEDVDFFAAIIAAGFELRFDPRPLVYKRAVAGSLGADVEACAESHLRILDKHKARFAPDEVAWIRGRIIRQEGRAWINRMEPGKAFRCFVELAKDERSVRPLVEYISWLSRQLLLRILPGGARHALRHMRYRGSGFIRN